MIEFAQITGKTQGDTYQVKMRTGEHFYAPLSVTGIGTPMPSQRWIQENRNSFLALVTFEGKNTPIIVGFYPVSGADSSKYGVFELLLELSTEIVDMLINAKTNTGIGPMPFMPGSMKRLMEIKVSLQGINSLIRQVNK